MKTKLLIVSLALVLSSLAVAQPIRTIGNVDCGKWMVRKNNNFDELRTVAWLTGFMTGLNFDDQFNNSLKKVSAEQIELWMDNYCKANPLKTVAHGGQLLMMELNKQ